VAAHSSQVPVLVALTLFSSADFLLLFYMLFVCFFFFVFFFLLLLGILFSFLENLCIWNCVGFSLVWSPFSGF